MGIDFFSCDSCGETLADCGEYDRCEFCKRRFCPPYRNNEGCGKLQFVDENEDERNCFFCRREEISNDQLVEALRMHLGLTREGAKQLYLDMTPFAQSVYWSKYNRNNLYITLDTDARVDIKLSDVPEFADLPRSDDYYVAGKGKMICRMDGDKEIRVPLKKLMELGKIESIE